MSITSKLQDLFGKEEDTQPTNAEIEEKMGEDEVVGLYLPIRINQIEPSMGFKVRDLSIPVSELSVEEFRSIEEMKDHIKKNGEDYNKKHYFFDRKDEEVKQAVMDAFKEKRCEELREKKKELESVEEELEELNCEER